MDIEHYLDLHEARERVIKISLSARTLSEIETAKQALREWMQAHPEEQRMRDGFELLHNLQEIIETQETERAVLHREPMTAQ